MAETITYNFYEGSQKVDKIEHQVNNYNYGVRKNSKMITPEVLREHILLVMPLISVSRHWFSVCKIMMRIGIIGEGDFESAVTLINMSFPEGLDIQPDAKDLARLNTGTWEKEEPEGWSCAPADPISKGVPTYKTIAQRFRDSFLRKYM